MEELKGFLNSDVNKITGLPQRQIVHWTEKSLVVPSAKDTRGAGYKRKYDYTNLLEFGVCKELFNTGFTPYHIKLILDDLRSQAEFQKWVTGENPFCVLFMYATKKGLYGRIIPTTADLFYKNINEYFPKPDNAVQAYELIYNGQFFDVTKQYLSDSEEALSEHFIKSKTMIIINLTQIKEEIDEKIKEEGLTKEGH